MVLAMLIPSRVEAMSISNDRFIDSVVHKITTDHLQEEGEKSKSEFSDAVCQELGLSEEQCEVMRSIGMHSPALLNDLILQFKYGELAISKS